MFVKATLLASLLPSALGLGILFPAYFCGNRQNCFASDCPDYSLIASQIQTHSNVNFYTIINPSDGPMSPADLYPNYPACIPTLKTAGSNSVVVGYVRTNYTNRDAAQVRADIDTYTTWDASYRPTGIFFDEVNSTASAVSIYASYASYARSKNFDFIVFNPGVSTDAGYFSSADLIVTNETPSSSFSPSNLVISPSEPAAKQAVLLYNAPTLPASTISQLGSLGVGTVFITDDGLPNPWDTVPSYWADEVADVAAAN